MAFDGCPRDGAMAQLAKPPPSHIPSPEVHSYHTHGGCDVAAEDCHPCPRRENSSSLMVGTKPQEERALWGKEGSGAAGLRKLYLPLATAQLSLYPTGER